MIIKAINKQKSLDFDPQSVIPLVEQVLKGEKVTCEEVSIYFVTTRKISQLHGEFFDDPSPTDCITFPMDEDEDVIPYRILGEVFVCPQTALKYAQAHALDPLEETTLYIVHGLLHLIGYDDIEEKDRECMRKAEAKHMKRLKKLNLYLKIRMQ